MLPLHHDKNARKHIIFPSLEISFCLKLYSSFFQQETNIVNNYNTTNINNAGDGADTTAADNAPGDVPETDAENFNPHAGEGQEPEPPAPTEGVDDGLTAGPPALDDGGLQTGGLGGLEPVENLIPEGVDPEFLQNSATGGVVGFSELDPTALETDPVALEDELDINAPPMDDFTMVDYGDDGYDMGGGFDIDMGGGYDMDMGMGDMDFGFWIRLIVQRYQTMAKWTNLFV